MNEPIVGTAAGEVRGRREDGVRAFRGIPYAEPPTGSLRFAAPVPRAAWTGVLDAGDFGPAPVQDTILAARPSLWNPGDGHDCLTVNLWRPDTEDDGLPVLVWIYGGAFRMGSSSEPYYDGAALARAGVVLVSLNYRVGFQGFGSLPDAPENRGLLDQLTALEWVRDNVASFGGDPGRVTVFGESAGASSVAILLSAPRAKGLFSRAIASSPASGMADPAQTVRVTAAIADALGRPGTAAGLADVPDADLLAAQAQAPVALGSPVPAFVPVIDGETVLAEPAAALAAGHGHPVDLLVGANADEATIFTLPLPEEAMDPERLARALGLDDAGLAAYRELVGEAAGARALHTRIFSDGLFRMTALDLARTHARSGAGRTFRYELGWPSPALDGALGACHALDLPLVFGNLDCPESHRLLGGPPSRDAAEVSASMRAAWVAFATTGAPGPDWPATTMAGSPARIIDTPGRIEAGHLDAEAAIWAEHSTRFTH
ncbi:carboxylesterase/lipase family protein [Nocardioides sp. L-11A]|uniref:carboxylesterase/lipase family protein n=1 Tax=Nocardioides sp. L-11A TaxID=3043848 RepID=UPI00249C2FA0|nr:carboxylesterase family protein [Nocardioides sp. L-11A]